MMQLLLARKDVVADAKDSEGRTPLSLAASYGQFTVVKLLLDYTRADIVNDQDAFGQTPLFHAAEYGHWAIVRLLLEASQGVNVNSTDIDGRTPLLIAAMNGHEAVVKLLLDRRDVDLWRVDNSGYTAHRWAIEEGHKAVRILLHQAMSDQRGGNATEEQPVPQEPTEPQTTASNSIAQMAVIEPLRPASDDQCRQANPHEKKSLPEQTPAPTRNGKRSACAQPPANAPASLRGAKKIRKC